mgnify:CR=1 FL=1
MKVESDIKIYNTLRSMFRLLEFQKGFSSAPSLIVKMEKDILKEYLLSLSKKEIGMISEVWPTFLKDQKIDQEIHDAFLGVNIDSFYKSLN